MRQRIRKIPLACSWLKSLTPEPKFSQLHMDSSQLFSFCPPKDFSQRQPSLGYPGAAPPPPR